MAILITSKKAGFRRAGVEHSTTATLYSDDHFTPLQLVALEVEPMLIVQHVADEPEGVADKTEKPKTTKPAKDKADNKDDQ